MIIILKWILWICNHHREIVDDNIIEWERWDKHKCYTLQCKKCWKLDNYYLQ